MPWSTDEKIKLLEALQTHGAGNLAAIAEELPFKSVIDIKKAIEKYEKKALQSYQKECSSNSEAPMDEWIQVLKHITPKETDVNPISRALKYIALFEETNNSTVNLSDCYQVLSDMTCGVPSKELTGDTLHFFNTSLVKMAEEINKEDTSKEQEFLHNLKLEDLYVPTQPKTYSKKNKNSVSQSITNTKQLNAFNVPEQLLHRASSSNNN